MKPAHQAALAHIEHGDVDDVRIISVVGELDISNVDALREVAYTLPNDGLGVVMDLTRTRFIDSTTIGLLFDLHASLGRRRQVLRVVCAAGSTPSRLLELTAFPPRTLYEPDVAAAVASIRRELERAD
jgi:anti-anti-sigma factor